MVGQFEIFAEIYFAGLSISYYLPNRVLFLAVHKFRAPALILEKHEIKLLEHLAQYGNQIQSLEASTTQQHMLCGASLDHHRKLDFLSFR